jgi:D-alanyl-D-alanine carboxypeptidase
MVGIVPRFANPQSLVIPKRYLLREESAVSPLRRRVRMEDPLVAPHGIENIIGAFGDIREHIGPDGKLAASWQMNYLARATLPFPLRLAWDPSRTITQMTCHRRMTSAFTRVFSTIQEQGLQTSVTSFGGCFAFRPQRTGYKLSAHSWGIAIDLNTESNPQGSAGTMDAAVIDIFRSAGFAWGGEWEGKTRDPMHFQFCTGY